MSQKSKYWVLSLLLGGILWLVQPLPSWGAAPSTSADAKVLHVINRLSYGPRPGDLERVKSMGIEAYIQSQLNPASLPEPPSLTQQLNRLETLKLDSIQLFREYGPTHPERSLKARDQPIQARLLRALESPRQLQEVMVDFWYNHFNVPSQKGWTGIWVGAYENEAIRPYALGNFRQLLGATAKHPAMILYLDNWKNRVRALNENYARELMELHTLGVNGGYTQQDVIALARIFSGWGFRNPAGGQPESYGFYFNPQRHEPGDKVFLGQQIKGSGIAEGEQALDILANSPATARHISYKLVQYFVSDQPPPALVERLSQRFLQTQGNIRAVLHTLFNSPGFQNPQYYNTKFKTPLQYVISAVRATGIEVNNFIPINIVLRQLGMVVYGCPTPDGYKNTQEAWLNPEAMTRRLSFVTALAGGYFALGKPPGNKALSNQGQPVDALGLGNTLANIFSPRTQKTLTTSPPHLRSALILGSPEFMHR